MIRYRNIKSVKPIPRSMLAAAMLGASAIVLGASTAAALESVS